jgi:hypothetical protein
MSDADERGLERHVSDLAQVAGQQAEVMTKMADQVRVLFTLNTALLSVLHSQVDVELVRARALKAFTDEATDANAVALINSMLGPVKTDGTPPSGEAVRDQPPELARSRFTVIDGGQLTDETES